jgi:hypothetical protein
VGFSDRAQAADHDRISAELYEAVMAAFEAGVNHATAA